jgi:hypothetical protein
MAMFSTLRMYLRRRRKLADPTDLYAHRVTLLDGTELDLDGLIVSTASKCGYTPHYQGLQELHERRQSRTAAEPGGAAGVELQAAPRRWRRSPAGALADEGSARRSTDHRGARSRPPGLSLAAGSGRAASASAQRQAGQEQTCVCGRRASLDCAQRPWV